MQTTAAGRTSLHPSTVQLAMCYAGAVTSGAHSPSLPLPLPFAPSMASTSALRLPAFAAW